MKNDTMRNIQPTLRIISIILMLTSILWGYWWIVCSLAIILLFYLPLYYEIILWGIVYDSLYRVSSDIPVFTIAGIILFCLAFPLKRRLIAYE